MAKDNNNNNNNLQRSGILSSLIQVVKNYSKYLKRQSALLVVLGLSALFIFLTMSLYNNITIARYNQVDMLVHSLLEYPAKMATKLIISHKVDHNESPANPNIKLQQLVDEFSENPYVISLNVFAKDGQLLSSSQANYKKQLTSNKQFIDHSDGRIYLFPLLIENKSVGFLQLKFAYKKMLKTFTIFQFDTVKSILSLFILLLILGVMVGVIVNRVHHKFRLKE